MDRFVALTVFAKVVEQGSFARAANRLEMSTSAVSRRVGELEAHLQVRLLNRTTRRLSLTESGQAFYERCVQLLADLEEAEQAVSATAIVPRGTLKLTCAVTFGIRHLAPALSDFAVRYPQLRFDVELSDRAVDIVDEGLDLAIRIGDIGSQALIGRRIGAMRLVRCHGDLSGAAGARQKTQKETCQRDSALPSLVHAPMLADAGAGEARFAPRPARRSRA